MTYDQLNKLNNLELDRIACKNILGEEIVKMAREILTKRGYYK